MGEPIMLRVDNEHAKAVCKIGQGKECCRYLAMGGGGWSCQKFTDLRFYLDARVEAGTLGAQGDNCEGRAP